jgi:biotin carboxyl carrier protein
VTFLVDVGGRRVRVELAREEQGWRATVDGRAMHVDATQTGAWMSLLAGPADVASGFSRTWLASSHEIAIADRGRGAMVVHVDGTAIPLTIVDSRAIRLRRGHSETATAAGPQAIAAPMPGRVVKVLVKPGEAVTAGQGLVVVEAMKMENELRSPKDGTVADVRASEGMLVEAGAVLAIVE